VSALVSSARSTAGTLPAAGQPTGAPRGGPKPVVTRASRRSAGAASRHAAPRPYATLIDGDWLTAKSAENARLSISPSVMAWNRRWLGPPPAGPRTGPRRETGRTALGHLLDRGAFRIGKSSPSSVRTRPHEASPKVECEVLEVPLPGDPGIAVDHQGHYVWGTMIEDAAARSDDAGREVAMALLSNMQRSAKQRAADVPATDGTRSRPDEERSRLNIHTLSVFSPFGGLARGRRGRRFACGRECLGGVKW